MNQFDINIGQLNRHYKETWGILNAVLLANDEKLIMRERLSRLTQEAVDRIGLGVPIDVFLNDHPEVTYNSEERRWHVNNQGFHEDATNSWLLLYDCFERDKVVYSWLTDLLVDPNDPNFWELFVIYWHKVGPMQSDQFLAYHLEQGIAVDKATFVGTLKKLPLTYPTLLPAGIFVELINQFQALDEVSLDIAGAKRIIKIRLPRLVRRVKDNVTSLTLKQTARLIVYLQQEKVIFKDYTYQPNTNIYKAWHVLTGYNSDSLKKEIEKNTSTKEDLESIHLIVKELLKSIEKELKQARDPKNK